jgi:hypothetical protein
MRHEHQYRSTPSSPSGVDIPDLVNLGWVSNIVQQPRHEPTAFQLLTRWRRNRTDSHREVGDEQGLFRSSGTRLIHLTLTRRQ